MVKQIVQATVVQPHTRIRRERLLPKPGEVVVRVGQEVNALQAVARTPMETDFQIVPISEKLGVDHEEIHQYLQVMQGQAVEAGDVLAEKKRFLGQKQVVAPIEGTVFSIENGCIILQQRTDWFELRSMLNGSVMNTVRGDQGVIIETTGALIQGMWGSGREGYGTLQMGSRSPEALLTMAQSDYFTRGLVLVAGQVIQWDVLEAAENGGLEGLIVGSLSAEFCRRSRELSFPIIVTDGIGEQGMAAPIFELLQELEGNDASLFAQYDERSGQRPEIVVPRSGPSGTAALTYAPLAVGQTVRILRAPYASKIGRVAKLYTMAQSTAVSTRVHGADIQLPDGQIVFVPHQNLDIIM